MRAMILSAGLGKRMRPLTDHTPKPLLKLRGTPLIIYHVRALAKAGVKDIVINLGHLGNQIEATLGDGQPFGVKIQYSHEDPILETGGGIAKALPLLGTDPFVVLSADIFTDFPFERLLKNPLTDPKRLMHLVLVDNPPHHPRGDFALKDGELSESGDSKLNFSGIGMFRPELFNACPKGAFPLAPLFKKAISTHQASGEYYKGIWHNIGTPEQLSLLEKTI